MILALALACGYGCATVSLQPPMVSALPLPRPQPALLLTVAVQTAMGAGNRPCEHLAGPVIERLREQAFVLQWQEAWTAPPAPLTLRLTFDCSFDEHPTRSLYACMLVGGTFFLAAPLPLFTMDYAATAMAEVVRDGQVLKTYRVAAQAQARYNYWVTLRATPQGRLVDYGEADLVARLVTALVSDRAWWETLGGP